MSLCLHCLYFKKQHLNDLCIRFPIPVTKRPNDYCGEYKSAPVDVIHPPVAEPAIVKPRGRPKKKNNEPSKEI